MKQTQSLSEMCIVFSLIALLGAMGCSDSYSSRMLTPDDIDRYISEHDAETFCLANANDRTCLLLTPKGQVNAPIIHIYPQKLMYVFYHEGRAILRAEQVIDTTDIVKGLTSQTHDPSSDADTLLGNNGIPNTDGRGDTSDDAAPNTDTTGDTTTVEKDASADDGKNWLITIYYPNGFLPPDPDVPSTGITVNGNAINLADVEPFTEADGFDGKGVQFYYKTQAGDESDSQLTVKVTGLLASPKTPNTPNTCLLYTSPSPRDS